MAGGEPAATEKPSFSASQSQMVTARVEAINHETREVTVLRADGETISFTASDEARNLDQVAVDDIIVAQYVSSISIEVIANDGMQAGALGLTTLERTEKGEMPGIAAVDTEVVVYTVVDINLEANTFKLEAGDGTVEEFSARDPDNLRRAEVGDLVVTTVTEAVAISVEPGPAD
jgi:pimeloyl-CoA synthetase